MIGFVCAFLLSWQAIFRLPDAAIEVIFKFFSLFLYKLSEIMGSEDLKALYNWFPSNLKHAQKLRGIVRDDYQKIVVCKSCYSTYHYSDCVRSNGIINCTFVRYPKHSQKRMRSPCQTPLMKKVKTASGKQILAPIKVFCYKSITQAIQQLVQQSGMLKLFNQWRNRKVPIGVMADVYDGSVWNSFLKINGQDFLSDRYSLGLLINVDWFQPYKHVSYSVGAIYIAILNFPRRLRFRRENMILIGIIPGPHEPSLHINSFLEPLVQDLLKLWKGIEMPTTEGIHTIRAALLCNSSDIPATRKVGGFVGHAALKGCSRCLKSFPTQNFGEKADYSGFDRSVWPPRTKEDHQKKGMEWKHANTLTSRQRIEREDGVRFTELLRLRYFDTVRFSVVDPMHNVLLGTAKLMVSIWKENGLITSHDFEKIQVRVNHFVTPPDTGRIPHKIASGFSSFTADQWKNWTTIFSLVVLKCTLPEEHYRCWSLFVQSCHLLCSRAISNAKLLELDRLLICFCKTFQQLYGAKSCTPNLHLHCHLKDCIHDFGPPNAFWLFGCERLNGLLGSVPTNHREIEIQLMRKFSSSQQALQSLGSNDEALVQNLLGSSHYSGGSLQNEELPEMPLLTTLSVSNVSESVYHCKLVPPIREGCYTASELSDVNCIMKFYFGESYVKTLMLHRHSSAIRFRGELYGSINSLHSSSGLVCAKQNTDTGIARPGFLRKFYTVSVVLKTDGNTERQENIFLASIDWLIEHENRLWFGDYVEVCEEYLPSIRPDFIPVSNILCRCAHLTDKVKFHQQYEETVTMVIPLNHFPGL